MEELIYWLRWLICLPVGFYFAVCALGNWSLIGVMIYSGIKKQEFSTSFALPFIGPLLGMAFFLLIPIPSWNSLWWTAMLIEPMWMLGIYFLIGTGIARLLRIEEDEFETP